MGRYSHIVINVKKFPRKIHNVKIYSHVCWGKKKKKEAKSPAREQWLSWFSFRVLG
jgi:hypothetical protein